MQLDNEFIKELMKLPASIKTALSLGALGIAGMLSLLGYLAVHGETDLLTNPSFVILVGIAFLGTIAISIFGLWSHKTTKSIEYKRDEHIPLKDIFENVLDNEENCYFIYSSTPVRKYLNHNSTTIAYPFIDKEKKVTTLMDVRGIAHIHTLLHLGGKIKNLDQISCEEFRQDYYGSNIISIGSEHSNTITPNILNGFNSPFTFNKEASKIIFRETAESWPDKEDRLKKKDYGLLVKLKNLDHKKVYIIIAGIGPTGTLACCYYLYKNFSRIADKFSNAPFGYVLEVDKKLGYTKHRIVKSFPEVS